MTDDWADGGAAHNTMTLPVAGVFPALVLGLLIMNAREAPAALPAINLSAAVVGLLTVLFAGKRLAALVAQRPAWVASVVLCLELFTLVSPGIDGVHRWTSLGGMRLHPAAIGEPLLLFAVVVLWHRGRTRMATALVAAALSLHLVQPDAGQATALAAGSALLSLLGRASVRARIVMLGAALSGAAAVWMRPDPLPPVGFVENIVPLAFRLHPLAGVASILSLVLLPASALWPIRRGSISRLQLFLPNIALAAYLLANALVVVFGEFPTPVLGFGASPILGAVLGLGLLNELTAHLAHPAPDSVEAR